MEINTLVPAKFYSESRRANICEKALMVARERALQLKFAADERGLSIRKFSNVLDAHTPFDFWRTSPLNKEGEYYSIFQNEWERHLDANKIAVFYGVDIAEKPLPVSRLLVNKDEYNYDLEALEHYPNEVGFFSGYFCDPIVIDHLRTLDFKVVCRIATGSPARVQPQGFIIEPIFTIR